VKVRVLDAKSPRGRVLVSHAMKPVKSARFVESVRV
tara:strand:+ start:143 stop:250 length:108 start_codon:yes stop_codon:yes gene_type:complete